MFSVSELRCAVGGRVLFEQLQFSVDPGEWLRVSGAHGAGKTVLLRTLVGLRAPDEGHITWGDQPIDAWADDYRGAFIYVGHQPALKDGWTVLENLQQSLLLDDVALTEATIRAALQRLESGAISDQLVRGLSFGQRKLVALTRLLLRPAKLWVLDDPLAGLHASAVEHVTALMQQHLDQGGMLILAGQGDVRLPLAKELRL